MKRLIAILLTVCVLAGAASAADWASGRAAPGVHYMAILINGKKIGYASTERKVKQGKVTTTTRAVMTVQRMGTALTVKQEETHIETAKGEPLGFRFSQSAGNNSATKGEGTIRGGKARVTITSGDLSRRTAVDVPRGALMAEGLRLLTIAKGLEPGTKYEARLLMPLMLKTIDARITIGAAREVDLLGRVVRLSEAKMVTAYETGEVEATMYLNAEGEVLKDVKVIAGMKVTAVACMKAYAMMPGESLDVLEMMIVPSPAPLGDLRNVRRVAYRIMPTRDAATNGTKLDFLTSPSQKAEGDGNAWTVTVSPVKAKGGVFPYRGPRREPLEALHANAYLQCDANEVRALAVEAVGGSKDAATAAKRIELFVRKHVRTKGLSVGYATALEVARSRQGDCSECAVLAAAMCRSVGLPAQVVTGLAYVRRMRDKRDVFVPHAWFRVWVGDKWVDYDAAIGFGAGHIALAAGDGDPNDFARLVGTLGCFRIVKATKR